MNLIRLFFTLVFFSNGNTADILVNLSPKNNYFIGREDILSNINNTIGKTRSVLLFGAGGIGKSQIAKEYAWIQSQKYNFVWWINARQPLYPQLVDFAQQWNQGLTQESIELSIDDHIMFKNITNRLSTTKKLGLIVFDDIYESKNNEILLYKMTKKMQHHMIETTRNSDVNHSSEKKHIKEFDREESIEFLQKLSADKYSSSQKLNLLADLLKDYPLALAQAFAYIESTKLMNVNHYMESYKTRYNELMHANDTVTQVMGKSFTDGYEFTTETTTSITLEQIKKQSIDALNLVEFLSFFNHIDIPELVILKFFNNDVIKTTASIAILMQYGLISKNIKNNINVYSMHELISDIVRLKKSKNKKSFSIQASQIIDDMIPDKLNDSIGLFAQEGYYLEHINKLFKESLKHNYFNVGLVNIKLRQLEYFLPEKRDKKNSEIIIAEITYLLKKLSTVPAIVHARFLLMQAAFSAWMLDDLDKSNKEALEAQHYLKKQKHIRNEELMMLYMRLSQNFVLQADIDNALKYTELAEKIAKNDKSTKQNNLDVIYQAKGIALWDKGDLQNAMLYFNMALEGSKNTNIKISDIGVVSYQSRVLLALQKTKEAFKLADQVEKIVAKFLGKISDLAYVVPMVKANCLYHTGDLSQADTNIQKSIEILKKFYPQSQTKGNRKFGYVYMIAGDIYAAKKEHDKAIEYYKISENMYFSGLKHYKIREISDLYTKMAKLYFDSSEIGLAVEYRNKHEELFGIADDNSLEINLHINPMAQHRSEV